MTEDTQGSYCPYCGAWNSVSAGKCANCGADLQHSSEEVYSGDTWRIVQDDIVIVPERPVVTEKIEQAPPRSKLLVRALLFVCCFLVVAAAVGLIRASGGKSPKPPVQPEASSEESEMSEAVEASENSVMHESAVSETTVKTETVVSETTATTETAATTENAEPLVGSGANEHYYTAPAIRLTSFGGETTGNELVVHSHVHDNYNNEYDAGLGGTRSNVENVTEYLIGDQYKYFSFRIVLNYERRTDNHPDTFVQVYADGGLIYKSQKVCNGFKPEDVTLKIYGVEKLKVGICGQGDIRVVDPVLHNDEGYEQYSTMVPYRNTSALDRVPISDLEYWNGSSAEGGIEYITTTIRDNAGNTYASGYAGTHANQDNWVEYDITDCGYTKLTGTIVMNAEPEGADVATPIVAIYGGSGMRQLYKSDPVVKESGIQHFEVSLEDLSQFRLQISGKYNIRVVDCYLSK
jgi:hypothetical protein